jgi:hypothetical protein
MQAALIAVGACDWAQALGLDSTTGPGNAGSNALDPAQVQQLALARLILANPDTLILRTRHPRGTSGNDRQLRVPLARLAGRRGRDPVAGRRGFPRAAPKIPISNGPERLSLDPVPAHGAARTFSSTMCGAMIRSRATPGGSS